MQSQVYPRNTITLAGATAVLEAAITEARNRNLTICAVVVDEAGRFVTGACMDDVTNAAFEVASAKARHSANFRRSSKYHEDLLSSGQAPQILAIPGMMLLEGGLQITSGGQTIGAIGVSGAKSSEDGEIAAAGVAVIATSGG